jgi:hypothetical protein
VILPPLVFPGDGLGTAFVRYFLVCGRYLTRLSILNEGQFLSSTYNGNLSKFGHEWDFFTEQYEITMIKNPISLMAALHYYSYNSARNP